MTDDVIVRRKGEVLTSINLEEVSIDILTRTDSFKTMKVEMPPKSEIPELYAHEGEELRIMISGEVEIEVSGKSYLLKEGDVMWHKSTAPHRVTNPSDERAIYFSVNMSPVS